MQCVICLLLAQFSDTPFHFSSLRNALLQISLEEVISIVLCGERGHYYPETDTTVSLKKKIKKVEGGDSFTFLTRGYKYLSPTKTFFFFAEQPQKFQFSSEANTTEDHHEMFAAHRKKSSN